MQTNIIPRSETAVLRLSFDKQTAVSSKHVHEVLGKILGRTGCPTCGLGGLDILLRKAEIIGSRPFVATIEGQIR